MGPNVHSKEENIQEKIVAIIDKTRCQLAFQNKGTKIIVVTNHI